MKKIYWRPRGIPRAALALMAVLALIGMAAVERYQVRTRQEYYEEKLQAARASEAAFGILGQERMRIGKEIDPAADPLRSGLIGLPMSPVTSDPGVLPAKQTSINPNFAAAIVQMLKYAGVQEGDAVAVGCSGSFPALNVCVYAAIETLKLRPVVISSAAASQWGANVPALLWIDMERVLHERGKFTTRSVAASIGGMGDRGLGMSEEGRTYLYAGIERNRLPLIDAKTFSESIDQRMALFRDKAGPSTQIKAYINIGGGTTSVGSSIGKKLFRPGLSMKAPPGSDKIHSVMSRFIHAGVPVIHLTQIEALAQEYGLPLQPTLPAQVEVGSGRVFICDEYNRWLAGAVLALILLGLYALTWTNAGSPILPVSPAPETTTPDDPMI